MDYLNFNNLSDLAPATCEQVFDSVVGSNGQPYVDDTW